MTEKISMRGERIAPRMIIMNAIWTFVTSVVMRVTREAEEKRSMFSNENSCTRAKRSRLRFFANPEDALAAVNPAAPPHAMETRARQKRTIPFFTIFSISHPALISLMRFAMMKGMRHSIAASPSMNTGVMKVTSRYSPIHRASRFSMWDVTPFSESTDNLTISLYYTQTGRICQWINSIKKGASNRKNPSEEGLFRICQVHQ